MNTTNLRLNLPLQKLRRMNMAREIPQATLPYMHESISNLSANTFLHEAGTLVEKYPAHFIKLKNREEIHDNLQDKLIKYYNILYPNKQPEIDWTVTKRIASCASHKQNYLDRRHTFEQKFRINLITNQLPLNARLYDQKITQTNKCINCDEIETQFHLFQCQNSVKKRDLLAKSVYSLMLSRLPSHLKNLKVNWEIIIVPRTNFFMKNKTPRILLGYFCNKIQQAIVDKARRLNLGFSENDVKKIHMTFIDCWLTSFYKIIWLPRAETCKKLINKSKREKIKLNKTKKGANPHVVSEMFQEDIPPEPPPNRQAILSTPDNKSVPNSKRRQDFTPPNVSKKINFQQTPRNKKRFLPHSPSPTAKFIIYPREPREYKRKRSKLSLLQKNIPHNTDLDENPFYIPNPQPSSINTQENQPPLLKNTFYDRSG